MPAEIPSDTPRGYRYPLLKVVRETLHSRGMVRGGGSVVIGVSGGKDSMSLLHVLAQLADEFEMQLVVAHLHHGLRGGEADRDARFVAEHAKGMCLPFEGETVDPSVYNSSGNVQALARALRYRFFDRVADKWGAGSIATAHHRDDHVETLLMQLFRGTGTFKGILPVREGRYIRPLLEVSGQQIADYVRLNHIPFVEDSSNAKRGYLRNRVRQDLIPWIHKEINPNAGEALIRFSTILRDEADLLDQISLAAYRGARSGAPTDETIDLNRDQLHAMNRALCRRVVRLAYEELAGAGQSIPFAHVEQVCESLEEKGGRQKVFQLPGGLRVFLEFDKVRFSIRDLWASDPFRVPLPMTEEIRIPQAFLQISANPVPPEHAPEGGRPTQEEAWLDVGTGVGQVIVRNFLPGDRIRPPGSTRERKVKELFLENRISRSLRGRIPIIEMDGTVAWIPGLCMDRRFLVRRETKCCLYIRAISMDSSIIDTIREE